MKYLKLYESFEDQVKLEINNLLNNNLINDVKDMSLEYLDSGMTLIINVYSTSRGMLSPTHVRIFRILEYKYSHELDEYVWILDNVTLPIMRLSYEFILKKRLRYSVISSTQGNNSCDVACKELYERVRMAYPNEILING